MAALLTKKSESKTVEVASPQASRTQPERIEPVRRVNPLRVRSSILGLEAGPPDSE